MYSSLTFLARTIIGAAILIAFWFVLDNIHDRNTEIIVSVLGLLYCYIFLISRRLDYFGLSVFSFFGRTVSYVQKMPYDQVLRDDIGSQSGGRHLYLNVVFAALIELLCVFRLFTSLIGHGWDTLFDPVDRLLATAF
jgi:hypothetical protein